MQGNKLDISGNFSSNNVLLYGVISFVVIIFLIFLIFSFIMIYRYNKRYNSKNILFSYKNYNKNSEILDSEVLDISQSFNVRVEVARAVDEDKHMKLDEKKEVIKSEPKSKFLLHSIGMEDRMKSMYFFKKICNDIRVPEHSCKKESCNANQHSNKEDYNLIDTMLKEAVRHIILLSQISSVKSKNDICKSDNFLMRIIKKHETTKEIRDFTDYVYQALRRTQQDVSSNTPQRFWFILIANSSVSKLGKIFLFINNNDICDYLKHSLSIVFKLLKKSSSKNNSDIDNFNIFEINIDLLYFKYNINIGSILQNVIVNIKGNACSLSSIIVSPVWKKMSEMDGIISLFKFNKINQCDQNNTSKSKSPKIMVLGGKKVDASSCITLESIKDKKVVINFVNHDDSNVHDLNNSSAILVFNQNAIFNYLLQLQKISFSGYDLSFSKKTTKEKKNTININKFKYRFTDSIEDILALKNACFVEDLERIHLRDCQFDLDIFKDLMSHYLHKYVDDVFIDTTNQQDLKKKPQLKVLLISLTELIDFVVQKSVVVPTSKSILKKAHECKQSFSKSMNDYLERMKAKETLIASSRAICSPDTHYSSLNASVSSLESSMQTK